MGGHDGGQARFAARQIPGTAGPLWLRHQVRGPAHASIHLMQKTPCLYPRACSVCCQVRVASRATAATNQMSAVCWGVSAALEGAVIGCQCPDGHGLLPKVRAHGCRALEKLANPEEGAPSRDVLQLRGELFSKLGWSHWAAYEEDKLKTYFPVAYPLF